MVYIQLERRALLALHWSAGTDLAVLTCQLLLDCEIVISFFYFLSRFLSFLFSFFKFYCILRRFFASLPSLTHFFSPCSIKRERPFVLFQTIRSAIRTFLAHAKSTGMKTLAEKTLAVILNCRWQVKKMKVPFNSVWKVNIFFFAKKKITIKIGKQKRAWY